MSDPEKSVDNVVAFPAASSQENEQAPADADPTVTNLVKFCEQLDQGMKLMIGALTQIDHRVKRLELAQQRAEANKAKPVIVDQRGNRVN
jgi:hypothetical protein